MTKRPSKQNKSAEKPLVTPNGAQFFGSAPPYPISRAVRAGDFIFTSAFGDEVRTADEAVYASDGTPLLTGNRVAVSFEEEVRNTFKSVEEALAMAGATLADVVDCQVWLRDPRDFHEMNRIYSEYFTVSRPTRSVFQNAFMFGFRIEIKVIAYKPL